MHHKLMTINEVSELLRVHPNTLKNWIKYGEFPPALSTGGRRLLWERETVEQWIAINNLYKQMQKVNEDD